MATVTWVALVGAPNVGKSTLFNRLTRSRSAIVSDSPGLTRDRHSGEILFAEKQLTLVDCAGVSGGPLTSLQQAMEQQVQVAMHEAALLLLVCDGRSGPTSLAVEMAHHIRRLGRPALLLLNKMEQHDPHAAAGDFYALGLPEIFPLSAAHGLGIDALLARLAPLATPRQDPPTMRIVLLGRPNVGKSSFINAALRQPRMVVHQTPGTTRDAVTLRWQHRGQHYLLTDTAGLRRQRSVSERAEKIYSLKTLEALHDADRILLLLDGSEGVCDQDLQLLHLAMREGTPVHLVINKWDLVQARAHTISELRRRCGFAPYLLIHRISALKNQGIEQLFRSLEDEPALQIPSTAQVTRWLHEATVLCAPPQHQGRRIKLKYAHVGGEHPLTVVIHGNQVAHLPESYRRFLMRSFQERMKLVGRSVQLRFKEGANPYAPTSAK